MSIKKLAKSINNLADAIRYHANAATPGTHYPDPQAPEKARAVPSVVDYMPGAPEKAPEKAPRKTIGECGDSFAPMEYVDPYDKPADAKEKSEPVEEYVDPYDKPADAKEKSEPVDAPGWQTLTTEELDAARPVDNLPTPPVDNLPPAPPAPPAPKAPTVADTVDNLHTPPVDNSVEVDANGIPWDDRIHSGGKTKLTDGTWRLKRGVEAPERAEIEAELSDVMAIPVTVPAADDSITTLPQFVRAVTSAKIAADTVAAAVKSVGLDTVMQLGARPDLIPAVALELGL